MPDSRELIQQVAREIEASGTTSPTPPGQTEAHRETGTAHVEAINQVFALFRLNYHNQYYAAYPDAEQLSQIKKLWLESLKDYPVEQILRGARHAIAHSEYLPTLNRMLECCQQGLADIGLPTAHDAYLEACNSSIREGDCGGSWSNCEGAAKLADIGMVLCQPGIEHAELK